MRHHQNQNHYLIRYQSNRLLRSPKIESKNNVIIISHSMLNDIDEESLYDNKYKSTLKITQEQQRKTFVTLSNLKYVKNRI